VSPPTLDDDPGLLEGVEYLPIEQLVAHSGVEALDEAVRRANDSLDRLLCPPHPMVSLAR